MSADQGMVVGPNLRRRDRDEAAATEQRTRKPPTSSRRPRRLADDRGSAGRGDNTDVDDTDTGLTRPITVFLLDDHEIVRRGLIDLLGTTADITVVGEAGTAADALARIPAVRPDVALLDARLPDGSGIDVCRDIRSTLPERAVPDPHLLRRRRGPVRGRDGRSGRVPAQADRRPLADRRHPAGRGRRVPDGPGRHGEAARPVAAPAGCRTRGSAR